MKMSDLHIEATECQFDLWACEVRMLFLYFFWLWASFFGFVTLFLKFNLQTCNIPNCEY